jgi:hypothetical protein
MIICELNFHAWIQKICKKILYGRSQNFKIEINLQREFDKKNLINLIMQSTTVVFSVPTFLFFLFYFFHFIFILKIEIQIINLQIFFVLPWLSLL